jgi:ATP-dependent HslUV protease subunit HslV
LDAVLIVADKEKMFLLSGAGDVIQPDDDVLTAGSGGGYALAASRALLKHTPLPAEAVAREAMNIAAGLCIYTNAQITLETLE